MAGIRNWLFSTGGISRRLIVAILLCSSLITVFTTAVQLYFDYRRDLLSIRNEIDRVESVHLASLVESVWVLDGTQIQIQIDGIERLTNIEFVAVRAEDSVTWTSGIRQSRQVITAEFPLIRQHASGDKEIGIVEIVASLDDVYARLIDKAAVILATNALKTFLVAGFMLMLFQYVVTRHLTKIAQFARRATFDVTTEPLCLDRPQTRRRSQDELDDVASAINQMITNLRMSWEDLHESENRFKDFAEASSDWFWEQDAGLRFTSVSPAVYRKSGVAADDHVGKTRRDIVSIGVSEEQWRQHDADLVARRPFRDFEFQRRDPSGELRDFIISGKPVFDAEGGFKGYRGVSRDITEQKRAEEHLRQAQKLEAVGQLTAGVAHDFNNILAVIIGNAELLAELLEGGIGDDGEAQHRIDAVIGAVDRASSLTSRLLAFSRQQKLSPVTADVSHLIGGLEDMLRRTLGETIDLRVEGAAGLWPATIDPHQFENALVNLAVNARDAMPEGGTLVIETSNVTLDETYAEQQEEVAPGDYVRVAVSDTGSGMSPGTLEKVFEPFFTTKDVGKGSGLGLSMVYGFAQQSGGHVTIYSEVDHGTTVKLYMPRSEEDVAKADTKDDPQGFARGSGRILLIEDDEKLREVPVRTLRNQGYEVVEAGNGMEAIKHLRDGESFDLLFTDVVLPGGMNGVAIAEEARRIQPGIKVLYTTGYAANAAVHNGRLDPEAELLNKPYRRAELLEKVRLVLAGDATRRA